MGLGFAPQRGTLQGLWNAQPDSAEFDPGTGLSIATRTNDIAVAAEGWHGAGGSDLGGQLVTPMEGPGGIGWGSAPYVYGGGFDAGHNIPGNLSGGTGQSDMPARALREGGASHSMVSQGTYTGFPLVTLALVIAGGWLLIHFYRTMHGHDGAMRGGAGFILWDIPLIVAGIWAWRWISGVAVQHNVPHAGTVAAFFTS